MQFLLESLAVLTSALYGILLARSKGMDLVGVCCIAFIVAFGGGTLRDVLLDRRPLFWMEHEHYAWIVFGLAAVGGLVPRLPQSLPRWLHVPDALGLGLFTVVGMQIAMQVHPSMFIGILFGVMTGTFGGVIADVACNEIPSLFQPTIPLYATCAFAGCLWLLLVTWLGIEKEWCTGSAVAVIVALRLTALRLDLRMPAASR